MESSKSRYLRALRFGWLTGFYDSIVALPTRERVFKTKLIDQACIPSNGLVLDVGCGTGTLAIWVKQKVPNATVTGLDVDEKILEIAREKVEKEGFPIRFDRGMSNEMRYEESRFDRVLSSLFFHHLNKKDKQRTFEEIYRVLRPGGELHIADWGKARNVFMRGLFYIVQLLDGFETTSDNVEGLLPQMMTAAGFSNVGVCEEVQTVYGTIALYRGQKRFS